MLVERNECCDCATGAYPCLGESCSRRHMPRLACDRCGYGWIRTVVQVMCGKICSGIVTGNIVYGHDRQQRGCSRATTRMRRRA